MAFVKPPARNMPPGSEPWAQWVEEQMSSVTKKSVEAYQYAERAAGGANSALEGNIQNRDEINRAFEITEKSMQLADGAVVWSTLDPELPEDVPINPNVIWYTYDPETREVLRMWQWGYYDAVEGIYVEDWYQAQLGADSIHDGAITSAKVALGAIDWDQIAPDVENTVTTAQETADKAAADLLIEKDRVNAELGPVKGDLAVLKTETLPALQTTLDAANAEVTTLKNTTIPALQTSLNTNTTKVNTLQNTTIPALRADLTVSEGKVNTLQNTTIPALRSDLTASEGKVATLQNTTIPNLQTALTNVEGAAQSADKRSTVSTAAPSATTGFPQNAVWQRINASGAVIGSWRLSGSSWVQMPLDPVVIPNLSAGIITSGVLNTARLNAQEIAAASGQFLSLSAGQITSGTLDTGRLNATSVAAAVANVIELNASRITAGTINTNRLNAQEIAAATGQFLSLSAGQITSGTLDTGRLNATSVAAAVANVIELNASRITAGTINTNRLNAQEVAGAVGSFLSLNTGQITWDNAAGNQAFISRLVSEQVFTNSLLASRGVFAPDNLVPDPLFKTLRLERCVGTPWDTFDSAGIQAIRYRGTEEASFDILGYPSGTVSDASAWLSVTPGAQYSFTARVVVSGGTAFRWVANFRLADGSNTAVNITPRLEASQSADTVYDFKVPAGAMSIGIRCHVVPPVGGAANWTIYGGAGMNSLRSKVGSVLIEDGAVTADKIVANAITARELAVGAITADKAIIANSAIKSAMIAEANILSAHIQDLAVTNAKIANTTITNAKILNLDAGKITTGFLDAARIQANSITTSKLAATAINGMTITGSTIQTSSSANTGIKIDSANGLRAWDSEGNLSVQISPSIKNAIAVRNPTGQLVPLSDAVFGIGVLTIPNFSQSPATSGNGANQWSQWWGRGTSEEFSLNKGRLFLQGGMTFFTTFGDVWVELEIGLINASDEAVPNGSITLKADSSGRSYSSGSCQYGKIVTVPSTGVYRLRAWSRVWATISASHTAEVSFASAFSIPR